MKRILMLREKIVHYRKPNLGKSHKLSKVISSKSINSWFLHLYIDVDQNGSKFVELILITLVISLLL